MKMQNLSDWIKKYPVIFCEQEFCQHKNTVQTLKGWKKVYHSNTNQESQSSYLVNSRQSRFQSKEYYHG